MDKMEIRLAGSGGQGVILATVILAKAAVIAGKYTAQSQSYGPEARGGACKAEVLISDQPIGFTKVQNPTFLMALTQSALEKYAKELPENCMVLINSDMEPTESLKDRPFISLDILGTAKDKVGKALTANIVAVGCINEFLKIVDPGSLKKAVLDSVPKGTEELNAKALDAGISLAKEYLKSKAPEKKTAKGAGKAAPAKEG